MFFSEHLPESTFLAQKTQFYVKVLILGPLWISTGPKIHPLGPFSAKKLTFPLAAFAPERPGADPAPHDPPKPPQTHV